MTKTDAPETAAAPAEAAKVSHDGTPIALQWSGDETRHLPGIPARDLSEHDMTRLVYVRSVGTVEGRDGGLRPDEAGYKPLLTKLTAELTGSGLYVHP